MRPKRSEIIIEGAKNILHITCKAARKLFVFRGKKKKRRAQFSERKVFVENTLYKLSHIWQADLFTFNLMDNHMHIGIGFDPLPFKLMSDREIIERACDLDVKSEKRGRFSPAQRKRWIEKQLADPAAVVQWRENFMTPSVFMKYLNEAVSRFINKQENTQGTLWSRPFHATRIDDPRGLLTAMMYIDLNQIRAGMTRNLEECMHSGIYYRMVDPDTLPKEQREHARKMKELLVPMDQVFERCGWQVEELSFEEYLVMLVDKGCTARPGKHCLKGDADTILRRYGIRRGVMSSVGVEAVKTCRYVLAAPELIAKAALRAGRKWRKQIEAAKLLFAQEPPDPGQVLQTIVQQT